jgi:hypothetical protein
MVSGYRVAGNFAGALLRANANKPSSSVRFGSQRYSHQDDYQRQLRLWQENEACRFVTSVIMENYAPVFQSLLAGENEFVHSGVRYGQPAQAFDQLSPEAQEDIIASLGDWQQFLQYLHQQGLHPDTLQGPLLARKRQIEAQTKQEIKQIILSDFGMDHTGNSGWPPAAGTRHSENKMVQQPRSQPRQARRSGWLASLFWVTSGACVATLGLKYFMSNPGALPTVQPPVALDSPSATPGSSPAATPQPSPLPQRPTQPIFMTNNLTGYDKIGSDLKFKWVTDTLYKVFFVEKVADPAYPDVKIKVPSNFRDILLVTYAAESDKEGKKTLKGVIAFWGQPNSGPGGKLDLNKPNLKPIAPNTTEIKPGEAGHRLNILNVTFNVNPEGKGLPDTQISLDDFIKILDNEALFDKAPDWMSKLIPRDYSVSFAYPPGSKKTLTDPESATSEALKEYLKVYPKAKIILQRTESMPASL